MPQPKDLNKHGADTQSAGASRGHPDVSTAPIVNKELKPTNQKTVTTVPHPGMRSPQS